MPVYSVLASDRTAAGVFNGSCDTLPTQGAIRLTIESRLVYAALTLGRAAAVVFTGRVTTYQNHTPSVGRRVHARLHRPGALLHGRGHLQRHMWCSGMPRRLRKCSTPGPKSGEVRSASKKAATI